MIKNCALCGAEFETNKTRVKYCPGKDCGDTAHLIQRRDRMRRIYTKRSAAGLRTQPEKPKKLSEPFRVDDKTREYIRKKGELLLKTPRMEANR